MAEALIGLGVPVVNVLVKLAVKEVENISDLKGKMEYLAKKVELLEKRASDVLKQVDVQELTGGRKRKTEIEYWLKNVDEKKRECEKLNEDVNKGKFYAKPKLGKKIVKKVQEVIELDQQSTTFGDQLVLEGVEPEKVPFVPSTSASQGQTFQINLEKVWKDVMDDNISSIGIYGMGGVGKSTLAKQVHDNLLSDSKFGGRVYWVTASQECTTSKLQNDIATATKISIMEKDEEEKKAGQLCKGLEKKNNFVLIIDDVWEGFEVEEIGIPCGKDACKLIITSRSVKLCHIIRCEKVIEVEVLSKAEAWELFQQKLMLRPTTPLQLSPEATEIARDIAKRCGGLPLGIVVMARSMRGVNDICDWRTAFVELKKSFKEHTDIGDKVFPVLMYSFNCLKDPILQNCFLYCSLYPEDYEIPRVELVRKLIIEGILEKGKTRKEEFDQGNSMLNKLEDVSLLVGVTDWKRDICVKMHDLVRDMALRITRKNHPWRFMVKSGLQLKEIPSVDEWIQDLNKVSLKHNEISTIPVGMSPDCPSLTSLNLSNNHSLVSISDSLFENILSLQTLDLSWTGIETLPGSISLLVNLKGLLLGSCTQLVSLPSLENLKALRELDLTQTYKFRAEIGGLESLTRNLKCLKLAGSSMKMIPYGTLKRLSCLQCLTLPLGDFVGIEALESLTHLEGFGGCFAKMDELRQFLKSHNNKSQLIYYDIKVGETSPGWYDTDLHPKSIRIINCEREVVIGDDDVLLMRDTKKLRIGFADNAKCILRVREDREQQCFPPLESLEYLKLDFLQNLRNIIEVGDLIHPHPATFSHLRKLKIVNCHKMKKVLPRCFLDNLINLEVLWVEECKGMEEIIGEEKELGEENNMVGYHTPTSSNHFPTLPKLRLLILTDLPKLKSIWKSNVNCNFITIFGCEKLKKMPLFVPRLINGQLSPPPPTLQEIKIREDEREWWDSLVWDHKKLKKMPLFVPHFINGPPTLQQIVAEREWWDSLEWDHPHHKDRLQPFVTFVAYGGML